MTHLEKAQELKAKGSVLSIEKIIAMLEKKEKNAVKNMRRSIKKFDERAQFAGIVSSVRLDETHVQSTLNQMKAL